MSRRKGRATTETVGVAPVNFPTGCVLPFAGTTAPEGWLLCDGSAISRTTYAGLYAAIGDAHGNGDGSTTFHIPDLRGRFVRGVDGAANRDPDKATRTAANAGGNTGNNVGSVQNNQTASHRHSTQGSNSAGGTGTGNYFGSINIVGSPNSTATLGTDLVGGNETRPININLNHIIKI